MKLREAIKHTNGSTISMCGSLLPDIWQGFLSLIIFLAIPILYPIAILIRVFKK